MDVDIWTDGSCPKPHGPGGFAAILCVGEQRKVVDGAWAVMTSPRAELWAAIIGLEALRYGCTVNLISDCTYVTQSWTDGWIAKWQANGWAGVKNRDLWDRLLQAAQQHQISWIHTKGHSGVPLNEEADGLARAAWVTRLEAGTLEVDPGYVKPTDQLKPLTQAQADILDLLIAGSALMVPKLTPALAISQQLPAYLRTPSGGRRSLNGSTANWLTKRKLVAWSGVEDAIAMQYTITDWGRERRALDPLDKS